MITLIEIFDMMVTIFLVGFLFMDLFKSPIVNSKEDVLDRYTKKRSRFEWKNFWFAAMVTAPAILLHELGHKLIAISLGYNATFHAFYSNDTTLFLGLLAIAMKLLNFGFVFLVPGYVSIFGISNKLESGLIAFAGPFINLTLFLVALIVLKSKKIKRKNIQFWVLTKNINLFLFIFNLLPIPGFDGFSVWSSLLSLF